MKRNAFTINRFYENGKRVYTKQEMKNFGLYDFSLQINCFGFKSCIPPSILYETENVMKINKKHVFSNYDSKEPTHEVADSLTFPRNKIKKFKLIDEVDISYKYDILNHEMAKTSIRNKVTNNSIYDSTLIDKSKKAIKKIDKKRSNSFKDDINQNDFLNISLGRVINEEIPTIYTFGNSKKKIKNARSLSYDFLIKSMKSLLENNNYKETKRELVYLLEKNNQKKEVITDKKLHYFYKPNKNIDKENYEYYYKAGIISPEQLVLTNKSSFKFPKEEFEYLYNSDSKSTNFAKKPLMKNMGNPNIILKTSPSKRSKSKDNEKKIFLNLSKNNDLNIENMCSSDVVLNQSSVEIFNQSQSQEKSPKNNITINNKISKLENLDKLDSYDLDSLDNKDFDTFRNKNILISEENSKFNPKEVKNRFFDTGINKRTQESYYNNNSLSKSNSQMYKDQKNLYYNPYEKKNVDYYDYSFKQFNNNKNSSINTLSLESNDYIKRGKNNCINRNALYKKQYDDTIVPCNAIPVKKENLSMSKLYKKIGIKN